MRLTNIILELLDDVAHLSYLLRVKVTLMSFEHGETNARQVYSQMAATVARINLLFMLAAIKITRNPCSYAKYRSPTWYPF